MVDKWFHDLQQRPVLAVAVSSLWLLVIGWIAFGWNLGNVGLIDETEPLFAEASRQMLLTGDWITPFFNGETRFDKPALIYWCQAIAYSIMGVNEWAARTPSVLAAMGVIALAFYTVQWHFTKKDELEKVANLPRRYLTAALAAALMALNPEMIVWGRTGVSDMLLTGCIGSTLLCFFLGYAQNNRAIVIANWQFPNQWYLASYVLIAGAILTKGPVGIVLPGLIMIAFALYVGKFWQIWREMRPILGMVIVLVLSLPWYILVTWRNGWNFINAFFVYHNIERFTEVVNGHSAPWYFYFLVVLLGFAPYAVYIPESLVRLKLWQRSYWLQKERSQHLGLFVSLWFLGVFGFFTVSVTKLPSYVLPLMPAAAILVALSWSDLFPTSQNSTPTHLAFLRISAWINVAFITFISIALFNLTQIVGPDPAAPELYAEMEKSGILKYGGIIWLIITLISSILILTHRYRQIIIINLVGFTAFIAISLMPAILIMDQQRQLPLRELSALIVESKQPNEELIMVGFKKPTVTFYTQQNVNYIKFSQAALKYIQNPELSKTKSSLLMLIEQEKFPEMELQPDTYKSLATKGAYQLIRISLAKVN
ncbi:ArnT family glycosyltransferase [Dolichospermum circinale]|uniref:ArnT family glycosyltransferase n=1 Tax=Dolichospermum circinale TaxID=109265 RepID=UPI0005512C38|nr:glycosyltransferase family 39 protein [Dolichospermum circinale]MDB9473537.1 glycosyltransferase family 39 protein [Dolichospermum circinale CS-537/11]MDB9478465.1 glycosyltransferase family 39 protein [Dolichospermum circinale CS-537/03]MDB9483908.1 glycosyltransferase family 39 protein [Dolichospermum circinale CS-537/05]